MKREFEILATLVVGLALIACFLVPVRKPIELTVMWGLSYDIPYLPAGPENKLANETAALKADREAAKAAQRLQR